MRPKVHFALESLGREPISKLKAPDLPVAVAVDSGGESLHRTAPAECRVKISDSTLGS
jgi:tartrate dehydratase beta subunit/fumarate hydratase class I family protein